MVYKKYEYDAFRIFTLKTDKFKNCQMEVIFRGDASHDDLCAKTFLAEMLSYSSLMYSSRKEFVIRLEELYNSYFCGVTSRTGKTLFSNFILDFLDPIYVNEKGYLEDVITFSFDNIMNPLVKDGAFDYKIFQIIKSRLKSEIESLKENPTNYSLRRSLLEIYPDSVSSKSVLGSIEELESITPESLYQTYLNLLEHSYCDIYVIGNLDMELVSKLIVKHFKNQVIKTNKTNIYVNNKKIKKAKNITETGKFVQSNLIVGYQMQGFTKKELDFVLSLFGEIFCGSSLNSKLYQYLRNDNSLCYRVQTIYKKFDDLLLISVGLESKNKDLAVKLIDKAMKEMISGKFSEEEFLNAKKQLQFALSMSLDNQNSILNNYVFHSVADAPLFEERKKGIEQVTKKDIMKCAKKFKKGLIYELKENTNEGN